VALAAQGLKDGRDPQALVAVLVDGDEALVRATGEPGTGPRGPARISSIGPLLGGARARGDRAVVRAFRRLRGA